MLVLLLGFLLLGCVGAEEDLTQSYSQRIFHLKQPLLLSPNSTFVVQVTSECTQPRQRCALSDFELEQEPAPFLDLYTSRLCPFNHTLLYCAGLPNTDFWIQTQETRCESREEFSVTWRSLSCLHTELELHAPLQGRSGWLVSPGSSMALPSQPFHWRHSLVRAEINHTQSWTVVWDGGSCEPLSFSLEPTKQCVNPVVYQLQLEPHAKLWTALMWVVVYSTYLLMLTTQAWHEYPNLSVLSQSLLMASHVPLLADLGFTWYLLTSCAACLVPLLVLLVKCSCSLCFQRKYFRLPSTKSTKGVGQIMVFLFFQVATTAAALTLKK